MTDYISREAAIDAIWKPEVRPNDLIFDALRRACEEEVKHIPAADVRPVVRGKWIDRPLDNFRKFESKCSVCGWSGVSNYDSYVDIFDFNFCPSCGADMREVTQ